MRLRGRAIQIDVYFTLLYIAVDIKTAVSRTKSLNKSDINFRHSKLTISRPSFWKHEHFCHMLTCRQQIRIDKLVARFQCPLRNNLLTISNHCRPFWTIDKFHHWRRHREQCGSPHSTSKCRCEVCIRCCLRSHSVQHSLLTQTTGPAAWNILSSELCDPFISLDCFRHSLKTYLYKH